MGGQASSPVSLEGVHVVVVGGGFGGIAAAQQLKSGGFSFTLIDMRDAFHHNVAALRASVKPGFAQRTFIPYAKTFGDSFVQGQVVRVNMETQSVILEGGKEIKFSHLILCTGTDGNFPGKFNTMASHQTAIQTYEDFVKQVILIHSRIALADPELLHSVRQEAKVVLVEKGVELLLGQKVLNMSELELNVTRKNTVVTTDKGTSLTTDLVISCVGLKVNSAAYASSFSDSLAENGALKVNEHLQVKGHPNVYAVGDCADVNEPKMAYHAGLHAAVAVDNISKSLSGNPLTPYHTGSVTMLLAMGHDDGVGQFNGFKLPRFIVTLGKSRDLLLWKSWREMKQKQP
ncbi:apoptosis-inducing factor 2 [Xyrichtys novacula]|uniref:Ferroptosis suppressor protein 1 n=1 Tax=Xyrichtys novacula TaxID=13765 RepID=A0AAV1G0Y8_XYRNO|nr:apoptosis-inducing factor 2 [Xyrichtys novacula]